MSMLRIYLLGGCRISHEGWQSKVVVTRTVQGLLAYLLLHRHQYQLREVLIDLFWQNQNPTQARRCLNTAIWRLRRVLEPDGIARGTYLVTTPAGEVGLNQESDYWLDVAIFEEQIQAALRSARQPLSPDEAQALESALQLYVGDLLEGFYDDWVLQERERLQSLYLSSLVFLMRHYKAVGAYNESLSCATRILDCDPLREEIHREMMQLYLEVGQRAKAVRQYEICRHVLDTQLGLSPMEETQQLYACIVQPDSVHAPSPHSPDKLNDVKQAIDQLQRATQALQEGKKRLQEAVQLIEHVIGLL
jgi:DNA-binding SARP family transcriptional activator